MARNRREQSDPRVRNDWIKEGRGAGHNAAYQPWLRIQDLSSDGTSGRVPGQITGDRVVHLLSGREIDSFYIYEASPGVTDIREQFPLLPLEETLEIAKELGVEHPVSPETGDPVVLTTDLIIDSDANGTKVEVGRDYKPHTELAHPRTREKFGIAQVYHQRRNRDWGIITDLDFPVDLARNLCLLREFRCLEWFKGLSTEIAEHVREVLLPEIWQGKLGLSQACLDCDKRLGLDPGTSLVVAYHFMYTRQWVVDLTHRLRQGKPLVLLSPRPN